MTITQFLADLATTGPGWYLDEEGRIRRTVPTDDSGRFTVYGVITFVCLKQTGKDHPLNQTRAAILELGLENGIGNWISDAAENPKIPDAALRRQLLEACRLEERIKA